METTETTEKKKRILGPLNPLAGDGPVLSVMNYEKREQACSGCGTVAVLFNAMDCLPRAQGGNVVICRCKGCLEQYAAEKACRLMLKTTWPKLDQVWKNNRRPDAPKGLTAGLAAYRSRNRPGASDNVSAEHSGHSEREVP